MPRVGATLWVFVGTLYPTTLKTDTPVSPLLVSRDSVRSAPCLLLSKWPMGSGLSQSIYEGFSGGGEGKSLSEYLSLYSKGNLILKIELGRGDEKIFGSRVEC